MTEELQHTLTAGCEQLGLTLTEAQIAQLLRYTLELEKWNQTYNLTAVRDAPSMLKRHVLDALSVVQAVRGLAPKTLADIGTGGGIPGVILAIAFPDLRVDLVESIGKKCRFLRHIVTLLGLSGRVTVRQVRVETWQPDTPRDIVICRAFTSLANFVSITQHLGGADTTWLAMKADDTTDEAEALPTPFSLVGDAVLCVPFEVAERHLLTLKIVSE